MKRRSENKMIGKLRKKGGFTLAELLIVVAIIAVLAAIAIPVFNTQLKRAKDGVDVANLRAYYAEVMTTYLNDSGGGAGDATGTATFTCQGDGSTTAWIEAKIGGCALTSDIHTAISGKKVKFTFNAQGVVTAITGES